MPSLQQKEITTALIKFYHKPVALVSLEVLLSLGLVIFLAVFAIQPTLVTMSDLLKEREEKIKLSEELDKKVTALASAQNVYTQIQPQLYLIDEAIPPKPELIKSLKIIEKLATENKVFLASISVPTIPDEVEKIEGKSATDRVNLPTVVSISGDYLSIRAFTEALHASRRSFVIDTVSFNLVENRGERKLQASITLNLPYFGEPLQ